MKDCLVRYLDVSTIGAEILHLPEARWKPEADAAQPGWDRLKPFAAAVDRLTAPGQKEIYGEAGYESHTYTDYFRVQALIPGSKERLFNEAVAQMKACDAMVQSWGAPPA